MTPPASEAVLRLQRLAWAKKNVLLVDVNPQTRDSRAKMLRSLGTTVHCAATPAAARLRFESGAYNLVLVDLGTDVAGAGQLADELKRRKPQQVVAFLVGRPFYVSTSLTLASAKPRAVPTKEDDRVRTLSPQSVESLDFGQKIRDAEAVQQRTL